MSECIVKFAMPAKFPSRAMVTDARERVPPVRPILLFQAAPKNRVVSVEKLKAHLVDVLNIREAEIKIATGDQKELYAIITVPQDVVRLDKDTLDGLVLPEGITVQDFASGDGEIQLSGIEDDELIEQVSVQLAQNGQKEKAHKLRLKHQKKKLQMAASVSAKSRP